MKRYFRIVMRPVWRLHRWLDRDDSIRLLFTLLVVMPPFLVPYHLNLWATTFAVLWTAFWAFTRMSYLEHKLFESYEVFLQCLRPSLKAVESDLVVECEAIEAAVSSYIHARQHAMQTNTNYFVQALTYERGK